MENISIVIKHLIKEFEQIDNKNFKVCYVKAILPAECSEADRNIIWSALLGELEIKQDGNTIWSVSAEYDENKSFREYTQYPLFESKEDTEPSRIVYGLLVGRNVTEGWNAIRGPIKKAVQRLLLRSFEPEDMPNADIFLDKFPEYAGEKVPIQQQISGDYLWFEFLFKLSQENGALIDSDLRPSVPWLSELDTVALPYVPKIQGMKTDVITASINALKYLLEKAKERKASETGLDVESESVPSQQPPQLAAGTEEGKKSTLISEGKKATKSNVSGILWQEALPIAKKHVKKNGYPGQNELARIVGCKGATIKKAVNNDNYLSQARQEYEDKQKAKKELKEKTIALTTKVMAHVDVAQKTELSPPEGADMDTIIRYLIEQAEPKERAEINKMGKEQREVLVKTYCKQQKTHPYS